MRSHFIQGINLSIAKLVYFLNLLGVKTYESHASFLPGDLEEQEYWAQKRGIEEERNIDFYGPILIWGTNFRLPTVYLLVNRPDADNFRSVIPDNWVILNPMSHLNKDTNLVKSYKLEYQHPKLKNFKKTWDDLLSEVLDEFDLTEDTIEQIYADNTWKEIKEFLISKLPLSEAEFNEIRNQGIKQLEENLLQSISNFDGHRFKHLADDFILNLNRREDCNMSYIRDISE